jgi:hypothetical protein
MDGIHECQHGDNKGSLAGIGTGCRGMTTAIYLDGGSGFGSGTSGVDIYGNVLDCSTAGALWINGGGNINFTNNVVISRAILPGFDSGTIDIDIAIDTSTITLLASTIYHSYEY